MTTKNEQPAKIEKNPKDKIECKICNGNYTRCNKSTHEKTAKHKTAVEHNEAILAAFKEKKIVEQLPKYKRINQNNIEVRKRLSEPGNHPKHALGPNASLSKTNKINYITEP